MTQEEKIKLAREWYNDPSTTKEEKSLLEKLFPDLSIPEGERIRKEIVKYIEIQQRIIKDEGHIQEANDIEKWLVWLRKQGEQKPVSDFNKHIQDGDEIVINENGERVNISQLNRVAKPREWIENYWQHHKVNNPDSYDGGDEIQFDHDGFVRFCNTYCKKPDWSEEDEKKFKGVISTITISRGSCEEDDDVRDLFDDEISWLESIKKKMKGE